jgi:hypothetical protein
LGDVRVGDLTRFKVLVGGLSGASASDLASELQVKTDCGCLRQSRKPEAIGEDVDLSFVLDHQTRLSGEFNQRIGLFSGDRLQITLLVKAKLTGNVTCSVSRMEFRSRSDTQEIKFIATNEISIENVEPLNSYVDIEQSATSEGPNVYSIRPVLQNGPVFEVFRVRYIKDGESRFLEIPVLLEMGLKCSFLPRNPKFDRQESGLLAKFKIVLPFGWAQRELRFEVFDRDGNECGCDAKIEKVSDRVFEVSVSVDLTADPKVVRVVDSAGVSSERECSIAGELP